MKQNMGITDRSIRFVIGILLGYYYFTADSPVLIRDFALVIAIVLLLTAIIGICPLYSLMGFSTKKKRIV